MNNATTMKHGKIRQWLRSGILLVTLLMLLLTGTALAAGPTAPPYTRDHARDKPASVPMVRQTRRALMALL